MLLAFALFGGVILAPQFQQNLLNFTATLSGLSILTRALGIMFMTFVTLLLLNRFKARPQVLLGIGFIVVAIANVLTAQVLTTGSDFMTFFVPLVIGGIGFGMLFVPLAVSVLSSVQGFDTQSHLAAEFVPTTGRFHLYSDFGDIARPARRVAPRPFVGID